MDVFLIEILGFNEKGEEFQIAKIDFGRVIFPVLLKYHLWKFDTSEADHLFYQIAASRPA